MANYIRSLAEQYGRDSFDEVVVIKGEALHAEAVELLRAAFPRARCTYYNWDSLRNYPHLKDILPLFDACFSFDAEDCESVGQLAHLPLFYTDEYRDLPLVEPRYDLSPWRHCIPIAMTSFSASYVNAPRQRERSRTFLPEQDCAARQEGA